MKESLWGYMVIAIGIILIFLIFFLQNVTNVDEHNMSLLKETTEASMIGMLIIIVEQYVLSNRSLSRVLLEDLLKMLCYLHHIKLNFIRFKRNHL